MNWNRIQSEEDIKQLIEKSHEERILIFKHSTRCSISSMALNRLERSWKDQETEGLAPYFLDLIAHRSVSNYIADQFGIRHESPQVLVIEKGTCIYDNSHMGISYKDVKKFAAANA